MPERIFALADVLWLKEVDSLLGRMVDNGLEAPDADLKTISAYLLKTYAK